MEFTDRLAGAYARAMVELEQAEALPIDPRVYKISTLVGDEAKYKYEALPEFVLAVVVRETQGIAKVTHLLPDTIHVMALLEGRSQNWMLSGVKATAFGLFYEMIWKEMDKDAPAE